MNELREAAQAAANVWAMKPSQKKADLMVPVMNALVVALALPDAQPVGWMHKIDLDVDGRNDFIVYCLPTEGYCIPLYAAPQPAIAPEPVPLTNQEVLQWWAAENSLEDCDMCKLGDFEKVVRALESKLHAKQVTP